MIRLRVPRERIAGGRADLTSEDATYLWRVLRRRPGDRLEVFDGEGEVHSAKIASLAEDKGSLEIGPGRAVETGANHLTLWQALPKGEKLEWVIQKSTELGVRRIVPFRTQRSVVKLSEGRGERRTLRWQKVAEQAARQCGRSDVPRVMPPQRFDDLCALALGGARVGLLHETTNDRSLGDFLLGSLGEGREVAVAVGPEGGFDPGEVREARKAGASVVGLGGRVLRAETAGIVVCALAAWFAGDLG
jgi:16S rRNA (uracil1498-N3)-methyltransferase